MDAIDNYSTTNFISSDVKETWLQEIKAHFKKKSNHLFQTQAEDET